MPKRGPMVLVIDDDPANLKLARVLLLSEGYDVQAAPDAEAALEVLQTVRPRLILTDIQLPGMDGLELTRRLRRDPMWGDTAIVALTAYAIAGDEEAAQAAGCDGYITKPLDPDTFPGLLRAALGKRGAEPPTARVKG